MLRHFVLTTMLVTLGGCMQHTGPVQRRFAREYRCPADKTKVRDLGAGAYRVRGCGRSAQYVCVGDAWDPKCVREISEEAVVPSASARAPAAMRPQVSRVVAPDGSATLKLTLTTTAGIVDLRLDTHAETTLAVATISPARGQEDCSLDLVLEGVRRDLPVPVARTAGRPARFFQELPLALLAEIAQSTRALGRICETQFVFDDQHKAGLAEFLMQMREQQAFTQEGAPSPGDQSSPRTDI